MSTPPRLLRRQPPGRLPLGLLPLGLLLAGAACAPVPPQGPTVLALPAEGRDLQQFQSEDVYCRDYAFQRIGYAPQAQAATGAAVGSAVAGAALGAAAGALIGSATGQAGAGAAIGAGAGLVAGTAAGGNAYAAGSAGMQAQFDAAYAQCMTSRGNVLASAPGGYGYPAYGYRAPYAYGYPPPAYYAPPVTLGLGLYGGYGYWRRPYGYGYGPGYRRW